MNPLNKITQHLQALDKSVTSYVKNPNFKQEKDERVSALVDRLLQQFPEYAIHKKGSDLIAYDLLSAVILKHAGQKSVIDKELVKKTVKADLPNEQLNDRPALKEIMKKVDILIKKFKI